MFRLFSGNILHKRVAPLPLLFPKLIIIIIIIEIVLEAHK